MPTKTKKHCSRALPLLSSHSSKDGGRALAAEPTSEVRRQRMCDARCLEMDRPSIIRNAHAMITPAEVSPKATIRQRRSQTKWQQPFVVWLHYIVHTARQTWPKEQRSNAVAAAMNVVVSKFPC